MTQIYNTEKKTGEYINKYNTELGIFFIKNIF